jgi:N6-adenosine-specific RNA methylase IME4
MPMASQDVLTEREVLMLDGVAAWRRAHLRNAPPVRVHGVTFPPGRWLNDMRGLRKKGKLRPCVMDALNRIGYDFDAPNDSPARQVDAVPPAQCAHLDDLIRRGFRFPVIYADPPWRYGNQATRGATDNHYVTMSLEDIAAMPVRDLATDDAWLFLWTTHNFLFDSQKVLDGWGFQYKSQIIWNKRDPNGFKPARMGMGNYARMCHEILIIASRGKPQPFTRRNVRSVIDALPSKHSAKPEVFRQIVESVTEGLSPRLELFGRRTAPGWTVFGNEVERDMLFDMRADVAPYHGTPPSGRNALLFGEMPAPTGVFG